MAPNVRANLSGDSCHFDRISDLPDHLLVNILTLLPLADAVRTCVLSPRWRHVWTRLPRLDFADDEDAPGVSSFADLVAGVISGYATDVTMPDVSISVRLPQYEFAEAVDIAESAFLGAQRAVSSFCLFLSRDAVNLERDEEEDDEEAMELALPLHLPCFPMVKELAITFLGVDLLMPNTGTFASLTKLYISGVQFTDDGVGINNVVSWLCPCLRDVELRTIDGLKVFFLFSQSVVRCRLFKVMDLELLLVDAPNLGEIEVTKCFVLATQLTAMYLRLPELKHFHWEDRCPDEIDPSGLPSNLSVLTIIELPLSYLQFCEGGNSNFTRILQLFKCIDTLRLDMPIVPDGADQMNLIENTAVTFFGELDLAVQKNEHMFGPTILNLLNRSSGVKKLSLQIITDMEAETPCTPNCNCRNRDNYITLHHLKWVVMENFCGTEEETDLLYSIVRNAKALEEVSIVFSEAVVPTKTFKDTLHKLAPPGCTFNCSYAI